MTVHPPLLSPGYKSTILRAPLNRDGRTSTAVSEELPALAAAARA